MEVRGIGSGRRDSTWYRSPTSFKNSSRSGCDLVPISCSGTVKFCRDSPTRSHSDEIRQTKRVAYMLCVAATIYLPYLQTIFLERVTFLSQLIPYNHRLHWYLRLFFLFSGWMFILMSYLIIFSLQSPLTGISLIKILSNSRVPMVFFVITNMIIANDTIAIVVTKRKSQLLFSTVNSPDATDSLPVRQ